MDNTINTVRTTADSEKEGRLIVSAGKIKEKKRKILKKVINLSK